MNEYKVKKEGELLSYLIDELHYKRNVAKNLLKQTSVNGKRISKYNYLLHAGDCLIISDGLIETKQKDIEILYEDEDLIAINKPSGILSVSTDSIKDKTAYHLVRNYLKGKDKHNRLFILHRIDRETSGVLVFAKNEDIKNRLQEHWNDIVTKRTYYALVEGEMSEKSSHIENYLKENSIGLMYSCKKNDKEAKKAITDYKVLKENGQYSLLEVKISTGRKNQIRATLTDLGHPVVGDHKYNSNQNPIKRLGLHASELSFQDPLTLKNYDFIAKMPGCFNKVFQRKVK